MVGEIVSVGTELLLGQIVDTNAAYLGRLLAGLGVDLYHKSTVGDNEARVIEVVRRAADRADLIITTGGLGPTEDDLTRECVAVAFGEELRTDEDSLRWIRSFFERRGIPMPERNARQAFVYASGRHIPNPNGTAPGLILEKNGKIVINLPGPPNEMGPMVENHVRPFLAERLTGQREYLVTRVYRFIGIGESAVEEKVQDLIRSGNPSLAPLAHTGEVHLRAGAKAPTPEAAEALLAPLHAQLLDRLGEYLYGLDHVDLETAVVELLRRHSATLACAESCTGGELAGRITSVPGASDVLLGGMVTYSNESKTALLGVPQELLDMRGAVSGEVARAMAAGVRDRLGSRIGVGITGIAGPGGGTADKPVGLVYVGIADGPRTWSIESRFIGIRADIRRRSTQLALQLIRHELIRRP